MQSNPDNFLFQLCHQPKIQWHTVGSTPVEILRLDLNDRVLQGNKAYKLIGHLSYWECLNNQLQLLEDAEKNKKQLALLSFGGRFSNHLHALAKLGQLRSIPTVGIVQGYANQSLTPTLQDCMDWGMQCHFVDRVTYRQRYHQIWQQKLADQYNAYVIPEGGRMGDFPCYPNDMIKINSESTEVDFSQGYRLLADQIHFYDYIWLAVGSGATFVGLADCLSDMKQTTKTPTLIGINCVADKGKLATELQQINQKNQTNHVLLDDYHGGGFGNIIPGFDRREADYSKQQLPIEPIYFDKLLLAFEHYHEHFDHQSPRNKRHLIIHGGGLQGAPSYRAITC